MPNVTYTGAASLPQQGWSGWTGETWSSGISPFLVFNGVGFDIYPVNDAQLIVFDSGPLAGMMIRLMGPDLSISGNFGDDRPTPFTGTITGFRLYDRYEDLLTFDDPNNQILAFDPVTESWNSVWDGELLVDVTGLSIDAATLQGVPNLPAVLFAAIADAADDITGSNQAEFVDAGAGNDTVQTGAGDDEVQAGAGNDMVTLSNGNDIGYGGGGNDDLRGGNGNDSLYGQNGDDTLDGGGNRDFVDGGAGNDELLGGGYADTLDGGDGRDRIFGQAGDDEMYGGTDRDNMSAGPGNDLVDGGGGNDRLAGATGNDTLLGGGGRDRLDAGDGDDELDGGNGQDTLIGGNGRDLLTGGIADDFFVFNDAGESGLGSSADRIQDFGNGVDLIDLRGIDANTSTGADDAFVFIGTSAFSGTAGELNYTPSGRLSGDIDGDGTADFSIVLVGAPGLSAGDFLL